MPRVQTMKQWQSLVAGGWLGGQVRALGVAVPLLVGASACAEPGTPPRTSAELSAPVPPVELRRAVTPIQSAPQNYLNDDPAFNADGTMNVVVEIPAGTTAKFEVTRDGTAILQNWEEGRLRFVKYLGYPTNYGMVPRTLEDPAQGGDGDPLDVLVFGEPLPRGTRVRVRLIGVMRMLDRGERDDKLLAVIPGGTFDGVADLLALEEQFPGVSLILQTWFSHYKGRGRVVIEGFANAEAAQGILHATAAAYDARHPARATPTTSSAAPQGAAVQ